MSGTTWRWRCGRCRTTLAGNPKRCPNCLYTVYDPVYVECPPVITYLLWSGKHNAWWRPLEHGYTERIEEAGGYDEARATALVVRSAACMDRTQVTLMVVAPPDWKPPVPENRPEEHLLRWQPR